jgi:predicted amidohydrolase
MDRKIAIAGVQMYVHAGEIEKNFTIMRDSLHYISHSYPFVEMVLFPELALFGAPCPNWKKEAITIPGKMTDRFCSLAQKYKKWLIPGSMYEKSSDRIYNTSIVISPEGEIISIYRKLFPWMPQEETTPGTDFCVFDVPGKGRFGLCICYDMWFPEVCRTLAWKGAEVILHPTMTTSADREQELILSRANAIFNQAYFIDVNGTGFGGIGQSLFVDPHGRVLQKMNLESGIMIEVIDLEQVQSTRKIGTAGVSQVLRQFKTFSGTFPPYSEGIANGDGFKNLPGVAINKNLEDD